MIYTTEELSVEKYEKVANKKWIEVQKVEEAINKVADEYLNSDNWKDDLLKELLGDEK
jgi:hypothetical protein